MTLSIKLTVEDIRKILVEWCEDNYGKNKTITMVDGDGEEISEVFAEIEMEKPESFKGDAKPVSRMDRDR